jgi:hypothetical protein
MKQWTLALHNYHDANGKVPTMSNRRAVQGATNDNWSANYAMLPFFEQQGLYENINSDSNTGFAPWQMSADVAPLPMFLCPSDVAATRNSGTLNYVRTPGNLVMCLADGVNVLRNNGQIGGGDGDLSSRLFFYFQLERSFEFCTDGLSNTIVLSESVVADERNTRKIKGGVTVTTALDRGSWRWGPSPCLALKGSNGELSGTVSAGHWRCGRTFDNRVVYTHFHTVLPPNAPTCIHNTEETAHGYYTATSNHTSGVNCGRWDGSVMFVTEGVDTNGLPDSPQGKLLTGPSVYGVWGAMGTPNGGETNTTP